ncbi:hypothetical protein KW787_03810 [Candidatus Pacearchaeota archaeon]|nr:hypothetical protein [Candidatus Pacearchaeota archaeon]
MGQQLRKDKKGVSEMVGYVLLVIIAVGISVIVYNFLYVLNPKDRPACEDDTYLIINSISCSLSQKTISLDLSNKGLYTVDAAYIRMASQQRKIRPQINKNPTEFGLWNLENKNKGLKPGESLQKDYSFSSVFEQGVSDYVVEVQPAIFKDNQPILCKQVVTEPVHCS